MKGVGGFLEAVIWRERGVVRYGYGSGENAKNTVIASEPFERK